MIVGQIDDLISDRLNQQKQQSKLKILGSSNGCIIQKNKFMKYLVYLNAILQGECICYYLNALALEVGQSQLVIKKATYFSSQIMPHKKQKNKGVDIISIQMKQAPNNKNIFAFKITQTKTQLNMENTMIALLDLQIDNFFSQQDKKIPLLRIINRNTQIYDLKWHPNCPSTFLILGQNQQLQIWDLTEDISIPINKINLKKLKKQAVLFKQIKFTSIFFCKNGKSQQFLPDYFNLYLLTNQGEIFSLFPFLINEITLPFQNQKVQQLLFVDASLDLVQALNSSELIQNVKNETIINCQKMPEQFKLINWIFNGEDDLSSENKRKKEEYAYGMHILEIGTNRVVFQFGKNKLNHQNFIKMSLIVDSVLPLSKSQRQRNTIYPIAKIRFPKSNYKLKFHEQINKDYVVISQGNAFYRVNISLLNKYLQTQEVKYLRKEKPFEVDSLFKVYNNESIESLLITNNCLYMVRSGKKTARFDICPLVSIGIFDKIESLNTSSKMIIAKLKSMKMSFKSQDDLSEFKKINSLDLGNEKIKKYKEEGLKHFKIDFDRYCSQIKNKIDYEMNDLKLTYENLKSLMRKFKAQSDKKKKLEELTQRVKENNKTLQQLLYSHEAKLQPSTERQINEFDEKLENLHGLVEFIKNKELNIDEKIQKNLEEGSQNLLRRLRNMEGDMKAISKMERKIEKGE